MLCSVSPINLNISRISHLMQCKSCKPCYAALVMLCIVSCIGPVIVLTLTGVSFSDLDSFPVGVALPLLDCIRCCREAPPSSWSPDAYDLIGRADISKTLDYSVDLTAPTLEMRDDSGKDGMDLDLEVGVVKGCGFGMIHTKHYRCLSCDFPKT